MIGIPRPTSKKKSAHLETVPLYCTERAVDLVKQEDLNPKDNDNLVQ